MKKRDEKGKFIKHKKIAIVGCSDSKDMAPFADKSWEIWGVNNLFFHIPRYDRWFEIHNLTKDEDGNFQRRGSTNFRGQDINSYITDLGKMKCPVMMQRHWDEIPNSEPYPLDEIKRRYGSIMGWYGRKDPEGLDEERLNRRLYGTNTVTYMILLAIMEGATHIGVWGVDMAVDTEYHYQRPSCEWALGVAMGLGIEVYIPAEADLMKVTTLYGFEEKLNDEWSMKLSKMNEAMGRRENKAVADHASAHEIACRSEGAKRVIGHLKSLLATPNITNEAVLSSLEQAEKDIIFQERQAREAMTKAYAVQQQYIGARQTEKEIHKIWGGLS